MSCHHSDETPVEDVLRTAVAIGPHARAQMHESAATGQRVEAFEFQAAAERVAFTHGAEMVAAMPCDDRDEIRQRARRLRCGESDRMAAVDEAYACANRGVMMRHRDIEYEAGEFRRGGDDVATGDLEYRADSKIGEM